MPQPDPSERLSTTALPAVTHLLDLLGEPIDSTFLSNFVARYGSDWLQLLSTVETACIQFPSIWPHVHQRRDWEIFELLLCEHIISTKPAAVAQHLPANMPFDKTLHVIRGTVGVALYSRAKSVGWREPITFVRALRLAELYLKATVDSPELTRDESEGAFEGRLAVSRALQSRYLSLDRETLVTAASNLEASIAKGNKAPDAYAYLCEILLRLFDETNEPTHLQQLVSIHRSCHASSRAPSLELTAAEAWLRLSQLATKQGSKEFARRALQATESLKTSRVALVAVHAHIVHALATAQLDDTLTLEIRGIKLPFGLKRQLRSWSEEDSPQAREIAQRLIDSLALIKSPTRNDPLARRIEASVRSAIGNYFPGKNASENADWIESAINLRSGSKHQRRLTDPDSSLENVLDLFAVNSIRGSELSLVPAIEAALGLAQFDRSWPTPLTVLARELERIKLPLTAPAIYRIQQIRDPEPELLAAVVTLDPRKIYELAANRALASREIDRRHLGGRTGVYLAEDYSGVVSDTFVFKPTIVQMATREDSRARVICEAIERFGVGYKFQVAETLGSAPLPVHDPLRTHGYDLIVARQFHDGEVLANFLQASSDGAAMSTMRRCIEYLALIHATERTTPGRGVKMRADLWKKEVGRWLKNLQVDDAPELFDSWYSVATVSGVEFYKRDAHALNWIATPKGSVVALDLEAAGWRPAGYELAQLTDDTPFLATDAEGWSTRENLVENYHGALGRFGQTVDLESLHTSYSAALIGRAIGLLTDPVQRNGSRAHGLSVLRMVGLQTPDLRLRGLARKFTDAWGHRAGLTSPTTGTDLTPARRRHISRAMAYELRHGNNVHRSPEGWADISDVSQALRRAGVNASGAEVRLVAMAIDEKRYEVDDDSIRAKYGHTRFVSIKYAEAAAPATLYHGTAIANLNRIFTLEEGLRPMGRLWVHLSSDAAVAMRTARRHGPGVLLEIKTKELLAPLAHAGGTVYLAEAVPPDALRVVTLADIFMRGIVSQ